VTLGSVGCIAEQPGESLRANSARNSSSRRWLPDHGLKGEREAVITLKRMGLGVVGVGRDGLTSRIPVMKGVEGDND
jgi:hypothetical protein